MDIVQLVPEDYTASVIGTYEDKPLYFITPIEENAIANSLYYVQTDKGFVQIEADDIEADKFKPKQRKVNSFSGRSATTVRIR